MLEVRDFDGDLEALAVMARDSWSAEYGGESRIDLYTPRFTRHLFADVPDPRFLIGAYDGAALVAFVANLPRAYRHNGESYRGVMSTLMVAHRDYRGAIVLLISECLRRNKEFGADFALMILDRKHRAWRMFRKYLRLNYRIERLRTMYALIRPLDIGTIARIQDMAWYEVAASRLLGVSRPISSPSVPGVVRAYRDGDRGAILDLTRRHSDRNGLIRDFSDESLARQLHTDDVTSTVVYERNGAVEGFVNHTALDFITNHGSYRCAFLDFSYWVGLGSRKVKALLAASCELSRDQGCVAMIDHSKNYYAKGTLLRSRFLPYPGFIDLSAWLLNPDLSLQSVDRVYEQMV